MLAKKDLVHGEYYWGKCRNATIARWNAERALFYHWRTKYGLRFIEDIKHAEDDPVFDVFVPTGVCDRIPVEGCIGWPKVD